MKVDAKYYRALGINERTSLEGVKRAYRRLAKKYHPDINPDDKLAEEKFKQIAEAYEVIKKVAPTGEKEYDYTQTTFSSRTAGDKGPSLKDEDVSPLSREFEDWLYTPEAGVFSGILFSDFFITLNFYLSLFLAVATYLLPGQGNEIVYSLCGPLIVLFLFCIYSRYLLTGWFFGLLALLGWLPVSWGDGDWWKVGLFASSALLGALLSLGLTYFLDLILKIVRVITRIWR